MILRRSGFYLVITNNIEFLIFYLVIISFGLKKDQFEQMILPWRLVYSAIKKFNFLFSCMMANNFAFLEKEKNLLGFLYFLCCCEEDAFAKC